MKKPTILFDLDGTVFDTAPEFLSCLNPLLHDHDLPALSLAQLRPVVSNGGNAMLKLGFGLDPDQPGFEEIKNKFLNLYEKQLGQNCQLFDGMSDLFDFLDNNQFTWGIVTNKPSRFAMPILKKFNILDRAKHIVCADHVKSPKPSAEPLLQACDKLNIQPTDCWYIGDSLIDVRASKACGMPVAIAEYGYFPENTNIQAWEADYYFSHPTKLISHFDKL